MSDILARFDHERRRQPAPGPGSAERRFQWLFEHARHDLSLARLLEADADARAIASDLDVELVDPDASYAVWAAGGGTVVSVTATSDQSLLTGRQPWAGGAAAVERALVLVRSGDQDLFDVAVPRDGVDLSMWRTDVLSETTTGSVNFVTTPAHRLAGARDYLQRPGFWNGAVGVAACWSGAASGLLEAHLRVWQRDGVHALAQLGAAVAEAEAARTLVMSAAADMDAAGTESIDAAERRARSVRYLVDAGCRRLIDHLSVGAGPYPLAMDGEVARRTSELALTIRQCHALQEVEPVGRSAVSAQMARSAQIEAPADASVGDTRNSSVH